MAGGVPEIRVRDGNLMPVRGEGEFVLYWMLAQRRVRSNFALQRAVEWAKELARPLVVLETQFCGNRWDSDRLHRFALEGMADNAAAFEGSAATYYPHVESKAGQGTGLVEALGSRAAMIVADEFPCFVYPRVVAKLAERVKCFVELVDSNGLLPLRAADRVFPTAHSFRRFLQKELPAHLGEFPEADPLARVKLPRLKGLPGEITRRWPHTGAKLLHGDPGVLRRLPIDHGVSPSPIRGGAEAASATLERFIRKRLARYDEDRNHPDLDATSGLSPYLHHGHVSVHEVVRRVMRAGGWSLDRLSRNADGSRAGWWGMSASAEGFLDELVTWRELGYNMTSQRQDYDQYDSLPDWAQATLADHVRDKRRTPYSPNQLAAAETYDELWNAAQRQLVREGRLHNYMRMLWGKKILEWSRSPREALTAMIELNNRYALDGRNPNSYTGIFWVLGRYDRPWGPERPIFGKVRYMSSENAARKLRVAEYVERHGP